MLKKACPDQCFKFEAGFATKCTHCKIIPHKCSFKSHQISETSSSCYYQPHLTSSTDSFPNPLFQTSPDSSPTCFGLFYPLGKSYKCARTCPCLAIFPSFSTRPCTLLPLSHGSSKPPGSSTSFLAHITLHQ